MDEKELKMIKETLTNFGYPPRGKILQLVYEVEFLKIEIEGLKDQIKQYQDYVSK